MPTDLRAGRVADCLDDAALAGCAHRCAPCVGVGGFTQRPLERLRPYVVASEWFRLPRQQGNDASDARIPLLDLVGLNKRLARFLATVALGRIG